MVYDREDLPRPGLYLHFKGKKYLVTGVVLNATTMEIMVKYFDEFGEEFVREAGDWNEEVSIESEDGLTKMVKRYVRIK